MISIEYAPKFLKKFKKLEFSVQEEVREKINLFKDRSNHQKLRVHKLHGNLSDCWAFYVNYQKRIVFEYLTDNHVAMLSIDDHDVYKRLKR